MSRVDPARLRLMVVTDRNLAQPDLETAVAAAVAGGATAIQLREKDLPTRNLLALAWKLRRITSEAGALLLVNDRVDVALAVEADGVHLPGSSFPPGVARRIVGDRLLIGVSTHTADEARHAAMEGADYVVFGPVFRTPSKEGVIEPRGTEELRAVARTCAVPVVAIGGIDVATAGSCVEAGAVGVAVIRAVVGAPDPTSAAAQMLNGLASRPAAVEETR